MEDSQPPLSTQASAGEPAHWCHQCNAEIAAEPAASGGEGDLICPDCGGGFIEAMDTARALANVRRAMRRHQRRQQRPPSSSRALQLRAAAAAAEEEDMDDESPQQVLRLLRFLARTARNSPPPLSSRSSDVPTSDRTHDSAHESNDSDGHGVSREHEHGMPHEHGHGVPHESLGNDTPHPSASSMGRREVLEGQIQHDLDETEPSSHVEVNDAGTGHEELGESLEEGSVILHRDGDDVDENENDEESDSEAEVGLLELSDWDSFEEEDEDEWDEVEFDEADLVVRFLEAVDDEVATVENREQEDEEGQTGEGEGSQTNTPSDNVRLRSGNRLPRNLQRRLQAIRRDLENYNAEIQFESPEVDTYVGNPGDYVDARGFEELLQQLIDTDNTRRGAPPAAKSAIECLPSVCIQQVNLENGSALCAICKDVVALDEPAKQLPCLHLYHSTCILPWLSARNSCPVCRYELPTDDPDYEEQKRSRNTQQASAETGNIHSSSTTSHEAGVEASGTEGNVDGESAQTETMELISEAIKEEIEGENELSEYSREDGCGSEGNVNEKSSLIEMIAGPLFSVVGLVVVSCLGNLFLGSTSQKRPRLGLDSKIGRLKEAHNYKPWWMRLFG